jgi:hypothetical protein
MRGDILGAGFPTTYWGYHSHPLPLRPHPYDQLLPNPCLTKDGPPGKRKITFEKHWQINLAASVAICRLLGYVDASGKVVLY